MPVTAVVGANWGDEGKGKITDYLAKDADVVARFQGGGNADHTVVNEYGKFTLHLLPSGVFRRGVTNVLGTGVAVDVDNLLEELAGLASKGVPRPEILVSDRAQVVMPYHRLFDELEEDRLGARQFGSTRSGIAPFYSDKYAKTGIQLAALGEEGFLRERVRYALESKNILLRHLYDRAPLETDSLVSRLLEWGRRIRPFLFDTTAFLREALSSGKRILLEGQLGTLRDPDHGIYPYSTSSSTLAGYGCTGAGVPPSAISEVVAVVKAYSSAVGEGPFVSELAGEQAEELRSRGGSCGEYAAHAGKPRRVGWFDAVATRYGCQVQGATSVALTNLDVLGYLPEIPVCVAYQVGGRRLTGFPSAPVLSRARPVLETFRGWGVDVSGARRYEDLPRRAQDYVAFVERTAGAPVRHISVGPHRDQTIVR